jgi:uncharacterized protein HemY
MHDMRRKIVCALTLFVFLVAATPVAAQANRVAINHQGRVIEVSLIASVYHIVVHGDTLAGGCIPPCDGT